ncbi:MAG: antitoxin [Calditrichaeota bacterium]|nr:antitoxin [Calditrichota bacterium]
MNTKLTLRLNKDLIETAKKFSNEKGKSLSRLVAEFFEIIKSEKTNDQPPLPPTTRSLKGILKGKTVSKEDYKKYIEKKYL